MTQILSQFAINVRDMDTALEFWHDVCELPIVNRVETDAFVEVMLQSEHGGSRLQLAQHFDCPSVKEYAREYIDQLDRPYLEDDLLAIARGQLALEDRQSRATAPYLFCDTDLRVINIWSIIKYGRTHPWITEQIQQRF